MQVKIITKKYLRKKFLKETKFNHIECNCSEYADWLEKELVRLFTIPDIGRSTVNLDVIAHLIANKANMPYCYEDIKNRLLTGEKMPFKLKE